MKNMDFHLSADHLHSLSDTSFNAIYQLVLEEKLRRELGFGTYQELAEHFRPHPVCPNCKSKEVVKDSKTTSNVQRFRCRECKKRFSALSNTIFHATKVPFTTWVQFLHTMCLNLSLHQSAELANISINTAFDMRRRVFKTVEGIQDLGPKLKGMVWIDETYITDPAVVKANEGKQKRGLSKQKICVIVAIDEEKHILALVGENGKPNSRRVLSALKDRIEPGSTIVHDKERAHGALIKALGAKEIAVKADTNDKTYLTVMEIVNDLCAWIKHYLSKHIGMDAKYLQNYLDWYVYLFICKRDRSAYSNWGRFDARGETDTFHQVLSRLLRHIMQAETTYRRKDQLNS